MRKNNKYQNPQDARKKLCAMMRIMRAGSIQPKNRCEARIQVSVVLLSLRRTETTAKRVSLE